MRSVFRRSAGLVVVVVSTSLLPLASFAQSSGDSQPLTKEQRKEARKQARAKKNAELKKLEDAGYNPARNDDTTYPQDIQAAEKKVQSNDQNAAAKKQ